MPLLPQHEADQELAFYRGVWNTIKHPSQTPAFFQTLFTGTRDYYRGLDLTDLDSGDLAQIVVWTRRMALKVSGLSFLLGLIIILALVPKCHAQEPWTPDNYNWSALSYPSKENWGGPYLNLTEHPLPDDHELMKIGKLDIIGNDKILLFGFAMGVHATGLATAVSAGSAVIAIRGCVVAHETTWDYTTCAFGLAASILAVGHGIAALARYGVGAGWFAAAQNAFVRYFAFAAPLLLPHADFDTSLVRSWWYSYRQ